LRFVIAWAEIDIRTIIFILFGPVPALSLITTRSPELGCLGLSLNELPTFLYNRVHAYQPSGMLVIVLVLPFSGLILRLYAEGNDNEKTDPSLSVAMYRKAADLDHARAQARLALLLWCGGLDGIRQVRTSH